MLVTFMAGGDELTWQVGVWVPHADSVFFGRRVGSWSGMVSTHLSPVRPGQQVEKFRVLLVAYL